MNADCLKHYLRARWPWVVVFVYVTVGVALRLFDSLNILPPCLWTSIFHRHCPGCGITRACVCLLQGRVADAWEINPLVFPAIVIIISSVVADFVIFCRNFATEKERNASKEKEQ